MNRHHYRPGHIPVNIFIFTELLIANSCNCKYCGRGRTAIANTFPKAFSDFSSLSKTHNINLIREMRSLVKDVNVAMEFLSCERCSRLRTQTPPCESAETLHVSSALSFLYGNSFHHKSHRWKFAFSLGNHYVWVHYQSRL